jgi:hypothetical protein
MKKPGSTELEDAHCQFLHQLCEQIAEAIENGTPVVAAIKRAARCRRKALFKRGHLSWERLRALYYEWKHTRSPDIFRRHYAPAGRFQKKVPVALLLEVINRMEEDGFVPVAAVMQSLRSDWRLGRSLPGLGTWQQCLRRLHGEASARALPPRFPFSKSALYSTIFRGMPTGYQQRIFRALRAQAELIRFAAFIDARRTELEAQRAHQSLGLPFSQQQ